jgi:superfamily II DNA/RNA helicase
MQSSLQTLNYKYSLPIQSFAWPAIFRQMNVFMIGGHKSGKTMSYLPAVCTFSTQPCCKYDLLEKYKGPLVIIICRNSKQCEEIFDLIKKLYSSIQFKPRIFIMTYPITNIVSALTTVQIRKKSRRARPSGLPPEGVNIKV